MISSTRSTGTPGYASSFRRSRPANSSTSCFRVTLPDPGLPTSRPAKPSSSARARSRYSASARRAFLTFLFVSVDFD